MSQDDRLVRSPVEPDCMLLVEVNACGQHDVPLSRPDEYMAIPARAALEPAGIVESAAAQSQDFRKTFKVQAKRRPAPAAEVERHALAARVGAMLVRPRRNALEHDVLLPEDRLEQKRGPREPLAETAVANGDAERLCERLVADVTAQALSLMNDRHRHRQL